ncbi:DEAD-domain-containing protein [Xylariaceae sp. FL1272]|nr:DEAD-domain-containing protein [Xylariaceae sp. FL1272]
MAPLAKKRRVEPTVTTENDSDDSPSDTGSGSGSDTSQDDTAPNQTSTEHESETLDEEPGADNQPRKTFKELGIIDSLCDACSSLNFKTATPIQEKAIPVALSGRDVIGLAETGSGKTAAFVLPILQALLQESRPSPLYALILAPTRELAQQIGQACDALGSTISLRSCTIVGGLDMVGQAMALGKKPHIVVATPGRLIDHLEKTKGFKLNQLKYLVIDEADRLLDMDFGPVLDKLLKFIPRERRTFLFSATMSSKVESLQRASLKDPVRVSVSDSKYQTVSTLKQHYLFVPHMFKDIYTIFLLTEFAGRSTIIFTRTVFEAQRISILIRQLGFKGVPLHGQLSQSARLGALNKFKSSARDILIATDVAARGLDIPSVDVVLNYDLPGDSKTYIHRVGRTARAGRAGQAINIVTQYDLEIYSRIEAALGSKLPEYETERDEVMVFRQRVEEAQRESRNQMKSLMEDRGKKGAVIRGRRTNAPGGKRRRDNMDAEEG